MTWRTGAPGEAGAGAPVVRAYSGMTLAPPPRRLAFLLACSLSACSRVTVDQGPARLVQTVETDGLRVEVRNRLAVSRRSSGLSGAGRGVAWYPASERCGVDWTAEAVLDGARALVHEGHHAVPDGGCEAAVPVKQVRLCAGQGRVALELAPRDHLLAFRFGQSVFVGGAWLNEGGRCEEALAASWDAATYLAHSQAPGALATLLAGATAAPAVRCFMDYRTWEGGTSLAAPSVEAAIERDGPDLPSDDPHVRFLRAVALGRGRSPDLEEGLYAFLLSPPPEGPFHVDWMDERAAWALSAAPSRERRLAYVERALQGCAELASDPFRRNALAEAIAQLRDPAATARARARCPGLALPRWPARTAHLREPLPR